MLIIGFMKVISKSESFFVQTVHVMCYINFNLEVISSDASRCSQGEGKF